MKKKILVTDTLFVFEKHVKQMEAAGYEVVRIEKPESSEEELCEAIKGKAGYILGGIETVTEKVIDSADELEAIAVVAVGFEHFVPAWKHARDKKIMISNTPGGPTDQVAEWAIAASLLMNRQLVELGPLGDLDFAVTKGIKSQKVGIIGLGRIGTKVAELLQPFSPESISYFGRNRQLKKEDALNVSYLELHQLLQESDIIFVTLPDSAKGLISSDQISAVKNNSLLVNITHPGIIDEDALLNSLKIGQFRAISDHPMTSKGFSELPNSTWYSMKSSNTITEAGAMLMSDMATSSLINMLTTGNDQHKVT